MQLEPVQLVVEELPLAVIEGGTADAGEEEPGDEEVGDDDPVEETIGEEATELPPELTEPEDVPVEAIVADPPTTKPPVRGTIVGVDEVLLVVVAEVRLLVVLELEDGHVDPEHEVVDEGDVLVVVGINDTVLKEEMLVDDAVLVRETVQPLRFRHRFRQRRLVHVVVDAGAVRLVEGGLGLPVRAGLEVTRIGEVGLEETVELAMLFGLVLPEAELLAVVDCPNEVEIVVPDCSVLLVEDAVPVKETVQPLRFKQRLRHSKSVQVVVEAKADELVLAGVGTPVIDGVGVTTFDDDVPDVVKVLGRDTIHLVPRPKQTLTHSRSVQVVIGAPEELDVVILGNPVTVGEVVDTADPGEGDDDILVTSVEALLVKETVHPKPRFRQAFTHRRSLQVAVIARFDVVGKVLGGVVGLEEDVVVEDIGDGETEVDDGVLDVTSLDKEEGIVAVEEVELWATEPGLLVLVDDRAVELLKLGFGTHVGPRHRLRHNKPEQEGVGTFGALVVADDVRRSDVLEIVDKVVDEDAVDPEPGVLVTRLLVVLVETAELVTVLAGVVVEDDKLETLDVLEVEELDSEVREPGLATVLLELDVDVVVDEVPEAVDDNDNDED
ncbi:MAG: hypothetical protein Q9169_004482 [Polycauliona sp. 2 TL-2023]